MNLDLAPPVIEAIEGFLVKRDIADVPGLIRRHLSVVVTRADVLEVYNRIASTKLGRRVTARKMQPVIEMPVDFTEHGSVEKNAELSARYGVGICTITRWRNESGCSAPRSAFSGPPKAPVPDGFALTAPTMTMKQLRLHYGRGSDVISRWLNEANVKPKTLQYGYRTGAVDHAKRDMTRAGQAADFLKRWCPVYRCDERGRACTRGDMWRRGNAVLTDAELIERAEAKGFDADAWKRVAA